MTACMERGRGRGREGGSEKANGIKDGRRFSPTGIIDAARHTLHTHIQITRINKTNDCMHHVKKTMTEEGRERKEIAPKTQHKMYTHKKRHTMVQQKDRGGALAVKSQK
jgi:hypothetical protein